MILKSRKIKFIFLIIFILAAAVFAADFILANTLNFKIIPSIRALSKSKYAYNFILPDYKSIIYVKNFKNVKSAFENSDFYKKFKDNYVFYDFKIKYYQNINFFFIKFDFNLLELSKMIKDDFIYCETPKGQFIGASVDFSTKALFTILNMLPSEIKEIKNSRYTYNVIKKGTMNVFYALIDDYIFIANSEAVMRNIFDQSSKISIMEKLNEICSDDDVYYKTKAPSDYNKFNLLPDIKDISFKMNIKTCKTEIECLPVTNEILTSSFKKEDYELMKLLPAEMPFIYFNYLYEPFYNFTEITDNSSLDKKGKIYKKLKSDLDIFKDFSTSLITGYSSITTDIRNPVTFPEIFMVFNLNENKNISDITPVFEKFKNILNSVIGTSDWKTTSNLPLKYIISRSSKTEFNIIYYRKYFIIVNGNKFADSIIRQINSQTPSLYDKYYKNLNDEEVFYLGFINTRTFISSLEPGFSIYLKNYAKFEKDEYDSSFGQLINYFKDQKNIVLKLNFDSGKKVMHGNAEFIEN
jgi:hypothetical protein